MGFTDSLAPVLYRVPVDARGRPSGAFTVVPLVDDWTSTPGFNANGIAATPDGGTLLVAHSTLASIYAVDLGGGSVANTDGLLLDGPILYVVQNALNRIAAVRLRPDLSRGEVIGTITSTNTARCRDDRGGTLVCRSDGGVSGKGSRRFMPGPAREPSLREAPPEFRGGLGDAARRGGLGRRQRLVKSAGMPIS